MKIRLFFLVAGVLMAFSAVYSQADNSRVIVEEDFCEDFFTSGLAWRDCLDEGYGYIPTADARFTVCGKTTIIDQGDGRYVTKVTADWNGTLVGKNGNTNPYHFQYKANQIFNFE